MDFKYIEIRVKMVNGEIYIIKERFPLNSNTEEVISLMNKKFLYTKCGEWVNTNFIEKFTYKVFTKRK